MLVTYCSTAHTFSILVIKRPDIGILVDALEFPNLVVIVFLEPMPKYLNIIV